jgi:hypothetical protein
MPRDPHIREKFTRDLSFARQLAKEYFVRYPKDRYETGQTTARSMLRECLLVDRSRAGLAAAANVSAMRFS